jgi:hypothetical protein
VQHFLFSLSWWWVEASFCQFDELLFTDFVDQWHGGIRLSKGALPVRAIA